MKEWSLASAGGGEGSNEHRSRHPGLTKDAQRRAADPRASAWVSANAGAGKTKVLTDRVVRLLLAGSRARPHPVPHLHQGGRRQHGDPRLRAPGPLGHPRRREPRSRNSRNSKASGRARAAVRLARTLFARAVETPGGLKIDTIHAFCERLLHLVPFEANVPARFAVLDESQTGRDARAGDRQCDGRCRERRFPDAGDALDVVSVDAAGDALAAALEAAAALQAFLRDPAAFARLAVELGLRPDETPRDRARRCSKTGSAGATGRPSPELLAGKATDQKRAASLHGGRRGEGRRGAARDYLSVFLTDGDAPRKGSAFVTKAVDRRSLKEQLLARAGPRVALSTSARPPRAAERTQALFTLARGNPHPGRAGTRCVLGALDFQDLIDKTLALLSRGDTAWVLYKLDRGIDHVLIDEAQDTNPEQWEILRRITEDFTAGAGARGQRVRTLFAVGDPKQSIYGFQGAAPQQFETTPEAGRRRSREAELHSRTCRSPCRSARRSRALGGRRHLRGRAAFQGPVLRGQGGRHRA